MQRASPNTSTEPPPVPITKRRWSNWLIGGPCLCLLLLARLASHRNNNGGPAEPSLSSWTSRTQQNNTTASSPLQQLLHTAVQRRLIAPCDRQLLQSLPKYNDNHHNNSTHNTNETRSDSERVYPYQACRSLPRDRSAAWLWQHSLDRLLELTVQFDDNNNNLKDDPDDWLRVLEQYGRFVQNFVRSVSSRVAPEQWGRVVEQLAAKRVEYVSQKATNQPSSPVEPVQIWILLNYPEATMDTKITWPARLQLALDRWLGKNVVSVRLFSVPGASLELYTDAMRYQAWTLQDIPPPDVVLYVLSNDHFGETSIDHSTMASVNYEAQQLHSLQNFVRAVWTAQPCLTQPPFTHKLYPVVVLLDTSVPPESASVLTWQVRQRVAQQIADHYQIGYWSLPKLLQDSDRHFDFPHSSRGQMVVSWMVLFGWLEATVEYCGAFQDFSVSRHSFLVTDHTWSWRHYLPPYLDASLSLTTVTDQWHTSVVTEQQQQVRECPADPAVVAHPWLARKCVWFLGGGGRLVETHPQYTPPATNVWLDQTWRPFVTKQSDWMIERGVLRATQRNAVWHLRTTSTILVDHAKLFVVRQHFLVNETAKDELPVLEWTVNATRLGPDNKMTGSSVTRRIHVATATEQSSLANSVFSDLISLAPWNHSHQTSQAAAAVTFDMELKLVQGKSASVTGLFLCRSITD